MNKMLKQNLKIIVLFSLVGAFLTACAGSPPRYWPEKTGRVLDMKTKEPIRDVYVLALWEGTGGVVGPQTRCYHVESAKTDEKGEFTIHEFYESFGDGFLGSRYVALYFHASNYFEPKYSQSYTDNIFYLEKHTGTASERLTFIAGGWPGCYSAGESRRNAYTFQKAIYEEAKSLAKTKKELETVNRLREILASTIDDNIVSLIGEEKEKRVMEVLKEQEK